MRRRIHDGSGTGHGDVEESELLKLQKNGQFPDESAKKQKEDKFTVEETRGTNNRMCCVPLFFHVRLGLENVYVMIKTMTVD